LARISFASFSVRPVTSITSTILKGRSALTAAPESFFTSSSVATPGASFAQQAMSATFTGFLPIVSA
jgi:hypothetical protein